MLWYFCQQLNKFGINQAKYFQTVTKLVQTVQSKEKKFPEHYKEKLATIPWTKPWSKNQTVLLRKFSWVICGVFMWISAQHNHSKMVQDTFGESREDLGEEKYQEKFDISWSHTALRFISLDSDMSWSGRAIM